ncbi:uncharacterized protein PG986_014613 [Apiospora aurea]|uniref:Uncharacterized protein n=1 Tax=Apiospora aurea TaxID=335848 RepID=A0ABR1PTG9_9PEZI
MNPTPHVGDSSLPSPVWAPVPPLESLGDPGIHHEPSTENEPDPVCNINDASAPDVVDSRYKDEGELGLEPEDVRSIEARGHNVVEEEEEQLSTEEEEELDEEAMGPQQRLEVLFERERQVRLKLLNEGKEARLATISSYYKRAGGADRAREEGNPRTRAALELQGLREEKEALIELQRRDKEAKEAVERYKKEEAERALREKEEPESGRNHKRIQQEQLLPAGLSKEETNAILARKKAEETHAKPEEAGSQGYRNELPTYTKMARRHLSLETLRVYGMDYQLDEDPGYVLIKRWVPEDEQDMIWRHTGILREERSAKDTKHDQEGLEPEFQWVRKRERRRSRSPSLLMYLAGAKRA